MSVKPATTEPTAGDGSGPPARDVGVVLAAGGLGSRYGTRKQFLEIAGQPVIHICLDAFAAVEAACEIVVVCPSDDLERTRALNQRWLKMAGPLRNTKPLRSEPLRVSAVAGGERRQDSVLCGLRALPQNLEWALVHDAARPLIRASDVERLLDAMRSHGAAALGIPCHDSVKRVASGEIVEELPREEIWTVQTPQGARLALLREAYEGTHEHDWTDEASVLRYVGQRVVLVEGPRENLKITRPGDEVLAAGWLRSRGEK